MSQIAHHGHIDVLAALHGDDGLFGDPPFGLEVDQSVDAGVRTFFPAGERHRVYERHSPPLELILVARGEIAGAVDVFGRAVNFILDAGECVPQAFFDKGDREMRDVDSDPPAAQLLRCVNGRTATAEGIQDDVALVRVQGNYTLQQGLRLLSRIAQALLSLRVERGYVAPDVT